MSQVKTLKLPPQYFLNEKILGDSYLIHLKRPSTTISGNCMGYQVDKNKGVVFESNDGRKIFISSSDCQMPGVSQEYLLVKKGIDVREEVDFEKFESFKEWKNPPTYKVTEKSIQEWDQYCSDVLHSWNGALQLIEEHKNSEGVDIPGFRNPQIGAIYSALSHWTVSNDAATITMPTGTGKTDTMLAVLLAGKVERVLIVVPTEALRDQTAKKMIKMGFFREFGMLSEGALYPVVGILHNKPKNVEEVDLIFRRANVVVTTMQVAGQCELSVQRRMANLCSHLIVDEAHHVQATTWDKFRSEFSGKKVLQFTATPFRNDGKIVEGKLIYNYPLGRAQAEGYFKEIDFNPVLEFLPEASDHSIARKAIEKLDRDLASGFDHLVMARTSSIPRALEVAKIYDEVGSQYSPVVIYSSLADKYKELALNSIFSRKSRIIICVNMLGEGFDLPELKIAALHDVHKSLAITLQFTGRFTRTKSKIGNATVIANIADPKVEESLQQLYSEDADWNHLLKGLSEGATEREQQKADFLSDFFLGVTEKFSIQNIFPKMSTVVYYTNCDEWKPENFQTPAYYSEIYKGPIVNKRSRVAVAITKDVVPIAWGRIKDLINLEWHLYLIHWSKKQKLLFIHSSNNNSEHKDIAKAIAGEVKLIDGEKVFRVLSDYQRLMVSNLGLNHLISKSVSHSMHAGSDVSRGLTESNAANKIKSNLFARGYKSGAKSSIGVSRKGRIWSHQVAGDISEWIAWCKDIGDKLNDNTIETDIIFKSLIRPTSIEGRPQLIPIAIEWPEEFFDVDEQAIIFDFGNGRKWPMSDVELKISNFSDTGPLVFSVHSPDDTLVYEVRFSKDIVTYAPRSREVTILRKNSSLRLSEMFDRFHPIIRYHDGSFQIQDELFILPRPDQRIPFAADRVEAFDWSKAQLNVESQTFEKKEHSIQRQLILSLLKSEGESTKVIIDDDGKGESADVVVIGHRSDRLYITFYHCKYTAITGPGQRIDDLYEVCGQAQKSVHWRADVEGLFKHLLLRDAVLKQNKNVSRFERGDDAVLHNLLHQSRKMDIVFKMVIVQPGISQQNLTTSQSELLAVTELYLKETYNIEFGVIGS
jgi:superfamily II DNA or RNA helicase